MKKEVRTSQPKRNLLPKNILPVCWDWCVPDNPAEWIIISTIIIKFICPMTKCGGSATAQLSTRSASLIYHSFVPISESLWMISQLTQCCCQNTYSICLPFLLLSKKLYIIGWLRKDYWRLLSRDHTISTISYWRWLCGLPTELFFVWLMDHWQRK